ncbi:MAG: superoxide dismutase family protein [Clostridiales bacterium]|nr:superoxide dismutase family protein [Clostridiales bacterium]
MIQDPSTAYAAAQIQGSISYPDLYGIVRLKQLPNGVLVSAEIFNLPIQQPDGHDIYGFHLHEGMKCQGTPDDPFTEARGHYNPQNTVHPYHSGDMPPLFSNQGYAYFSFFTDRFSVADVLGRTIIIHDMKDDFTSQPGGNSGSRIGCGIIVSA